MSEARDDTEAYEANDDLDAGLAAAFGPAASVFASLCESSPGLRPVELRHAPEEGSGLVERPNSREMPSPSTTGRYQVFGEIARGGMGAILRGRDPDLGRDIAIKVLREDHRADPKMIERFVEEAQIGGQLQHPGIAPVYELNQFSDRRPYFTMKLVKGRTLAALFANRTDLADNRAHLVSIFTHVAQTMAYAHSRGVIHRDLKPANIMVGSFGEVQVMDWGLAKVLSTGGLADEQRSQKDNRSRSAFVNAVSEIKTFRSTGSGSETMAGSLLGTPAYMAPEQARGDTDLVDERSDVFGLGAILCELLTGKPAYTGESPAEIQRKASLGELTDALARLDSADADEELVDLARRCIAAEPWDRPRDAKSVADAAAGYQAAAEDRLRRAEKDCAVAEMQAIEERKRRRVGMALVASVLLTMGMAGAGIWWWHDRQQKAARDAEMAQAGATLAVERGLSEAAQFRDAGRWIEGQIAARKAEEFLPEHASPELRKRVADTQADLKLLVALDQNRIQFSGERDDAFDAKGANEGYETAFRDYGVDINAIDPATAQDRFPVPIRVQVAEAVDHWALLRALYMDDRPGWKRLVELAQTIDVPNPWRQRLRAARLDKETAPQLVELARNSDRLSQSPASLVILARNLRGPSKEPGIAIEILTEARMRFPGDFWINFELGESCMAVNRSGEAVRYFNAALAARPQNTFVMTSVAWALTSCSDGKEAEAICRRVIQLQPRFYWAHGLLGYILMSHGNLDEAIKEERMAFDLDPKNPNWPNNLGVSHSRLKQLAQAEENYRKALAMAPDFAMPLNNLVELLKEQGRKADITTLYRDAVTRHADDFSLRLRLAEHTEEARDVDDAIACYRRKLAEAPASNPLVERLTKLLDKLNRGGEKVAIWREAAASCNNAPGMLVPLAFASRAPGDIDAAVAALQESLKDPAKVTPWNRNVMGSLLRIRRKYSLAEATLRDGIRLNMADKNTYRDLNAVLMEAGRRTDAIIMLRNAVKRIPDDSVLWYNLGYHLYEMGRPQEAIDPIQRTLMLDANQQLAWNILGFSQFRLGNFAEASAAMTQAQEVMKRKTPDNENAIGNYRSRSSEMARYAKIAEDLPAIVDGVVLPKDANEALEFAKVCQFRGFPSHAFRLYQTAFTAEPKLAASFDLHQAAFGAIKLSVTTKSSFKAAAARQQALDWLRSDLPRIDRSISANNTRGRDEARRWLNRWQEDESYSPVRDPAQLAKLPPEEKAAWEKYWADIKTRSDKLGQPEPTSVEQ